MVEPGAVWRLLDRPVESGAESDTTAPSTSDTESDMAKSSTSESGASWSPWSLLSLGSGALVESGALHSDRTPLPSTSDKVESGTVESDTPLESGALESDKVESGALHSDMPPVPLTSDTAESGALESD